MGTHQYPPKSAPITELDTAAAFKGLSIDSSEFLDEIQGRTKCRSCDRSRKFFCYTCYIPMTPLVDKIPHVRLPMKVSIVKHRQEIDGKSTAVHAPLLAPDSVQMFTYPDLPETENSLLVFPSDDAEDTQDLMERVRRENDGKFPYDRVIFIDSTWNQTYGISHDERLANLPKVKLSGIESMFWRYHRGNPSTHLATIEAIYHFTLVYHRVLISEVYSGEYDNLLFFFRYMFNKIRNLYNPATIKAYTARPYLLAGNE